MLNSQAIPAEEIIRPEMLADLTPRKGKRSIRVFTRAEVKRRHQIRHKESRNAGSREYKKLRRAQTKLKQIKRPHQYKLLLRVSAGKKKKFPVDQKERVRQWRMKKQRNDPVYALRIAVRRRIYMAFKNHGYTKKSSVFLLLGAPYAVVAAHLETTFQQGMSWANHGMWHIDHCVPLASATDEMTLIKLLHYTNLQALWAKDNLAKGARHVTG